MRIVIIGAGEIGFDVAKSLSQDGHDIIVVESDPDRAAKVENELDVMLIRGNGARPQTLERAGIKIGSQIDMLIACTNRDEVNIIACWIAKKMGVPRLLARAVSLEFTDSNTWRQDLGIEMMVSPERTVAKEIGDLLEIRSAVHSTEIADGSAGIYVFRIAPGSPACGSTPKEIRSRYPSLVMAMVYAQRGDWGFLPTADSVLKEGDLCYAFCYRDHIHEVEEIYHAGQSRRIKRVFIVGGGKVGFQTADLLGKRIRGIDIRIIDLNHDKCKKLATELPRTTVLWGDGADDVLLLQEGIATADGVVAATDNDELNLIIAAQAKILGAEKSIAVVRRKNYIRLSSHFPIDTVVSRNQALSAAIIGSVRHPGDSRVFAVLDQIGAETIRLTIGEKSPALGFTLTELPLPVGTILGIVEREQNVFIPTGDTRLRVGDKAVLFASIENMPRALEVIEGTEE